MPTKKRPTARKRSLTSKTRTSSTKKRLTAASCDSEMVRFAVAWRRIYSAMQKDRTSWKKASEAWRKTLPVGWSSWSQRKRANYIDKAERLRKARLRSRK